MPVVLFLPVTMAVSAPGSRVSRMVASLLDPGRCVAGMPNQLVRDCQSTFS